MKILLVDILSPIGHINYNKGLIRALQNDCYEVSFCAAEIIVEKVRQVYLVNTYVIPNELFLSSMGNTSRILRPFIWRKRLYKWLNGKIEFFNEYDYVLFTSSEPVVLACLSHKFSKRNGFVDHGIGKVGTSLLYRVCYKYFLNKNTDIIVLEEYISSYISSVLKKKICVVYHPVFTKELGSVERFHSSCPRIVFAPSGGNDPNFIDELIKHETELPSDIRIVLRSSKRSFKSDKLFVYCEYLGEQEYYECMQKAAAILIPYESSYNYRTSAIFFEAISNRIPVLIYANNTLVELAKKFPKVSFLIFSIGDIANTVSNLPNIDDSSFKEVIDSYSDDVIAKQFRIVFNRNYGA